MEYSDIIYGVVTAILAALGFILEVRRQRHDEARTDQTKERLAQLEAQVQMSHISERLVRLETHVESISDRLADFEQAISSACDPPPVPEPVPQKRTTRRR